MTRFYAFVTTSYGKNIGRIRIEFDTEYHLQKGYVLTLEEEVKDDTN